jgi:imidazolonepropionase-like amidohydrolase
MTISRTRTISITAAVVALSLTASTKAQAPRAAIVAIKGGTVLTVTKGTIQNGIVVLRDGKIVAVGGPDTAVPAGAEVIDAAGRFVSPGIIDCHSHIAADSINEGGTTVSSMTGIEDVFDPTDVNILRDLAGGLTVANVLHGSANPIGGKNQVIKLRWGKPRAQDFVFEGALPGIKFALGENPKDMRQFGQTGPRRYPVTREGVEFVIRDAFTRAKAYQREWRDYELRRRAGETVLVPRRDLQLEPLVEILEGKRLVHAHSYRADEILMLLRLADEMGFKVATLQHVLEGYKVADEIAAHGAGASTFSDWWGYKIEAEDAIPYNAALMTRRGVLVSVNSDSAEHARRLNTEAAKSMHWGGLSEDEALALVTINPAKQLRIDNRVGSLEAGKDADVVIWNHHPLSTYAIVDRVWIDGMTYYERTAEERRITDLRKEKTTLAAAEGQHGPTTSPQTGPQPRTGQSSDSGTDLPGLGGVDESRARQAQPPGTGHVIAITNAKINPISAPVIERGTIVIRGQRIEAIGANVSAPAGAEIIDAKGAEVYPGFIDARTVMGLSEPGPRGFDDASEMLEVNASLRAQVAYQWDSDAIPIARANGITTVGVMPNGGLIGGQAAVMNLDGWSWEEAAVKPLAGVTFQFPTIGRSGGFGPNPDANRKYDELKRERDARLKRVEDVIDRAKAYAKRPAAERATDWNLEALVPIVEGRAPLFVQANLEPEIRDAVAFAGRTGLKIVITGAIESPMVASLLKEKNIPVIIGSVLTLPSREDLHHAAAYRAAGELAEAGVTFAFGSGGYTNTRLIPYEAAMSVAWGLPRERALRAITLDAATILGVADKVGSLEPGKLANLIIVSGDPLELKTPVPRVFIAGRDVGPDNKHLALYERFSSRPKGTR